MGSNERDVAQLVDDDEGPVDVDLAEELSDGIGHLDGARDGLEKFIPAPRGLGHERHLGVVGILAVRGGLDDDDGPHSAVAPREHLELLHQARVAHDVFTLEPGVGTSRVGFVPESGRVCVRRGPRGVKARPVVDRLIDGLAHELVLRPVKRLVRFRAVPDALADGALLVRGRGAAGVSADRLTGLQSQHQPGPQAGRRVRQGALERGGFGLDALLLLLRLRLRLGRHRGRRAGGSGKRQFKIT